MQFALWLKQEGEGCDYTIGCGNKLVQLRSQTVEEAHEESKAVLLELTGISLGSDGRPNGDSRTFKQALLVIIGGDLTELARLAVEVRTKEKLDERKAEKLELERLKRELGE